MKLLTATDLAAILHRKESTIKADVCRRPHTLPPRTRLPGSKKLLWLEQDVNEWVLKHTEGRHEQV